MKDLTNCEKAVLVSLVKGYNNRRIGEDMGISEKGVKFHMTKIFKKTGVRSRLELILKLVNLAPASPEAKDH